MHQTRTTNPMPGLLPVQMDLTMPGCPSAIEEAWAVHKRHLAPMTLTQALDHPLYGRLIRAHAGSIEAMRRRAAKRRMRRVRR